MVLRQDPQSLTFVMVITICLVQQIVYKCVYKVENGMEQCPQPVLKVHVYTVEPLFVDTIGPRKCREGVYKVKDTS